MNRERSELRKFSILDHSRHNNHRSAAFGVGWGGGGAGAPPGPASVLCLLHYY